MCLEGDKDAALTHFDVPSLMDMLPPFCTIVIDIAWPNHSVSLWAGKWEAAEIERLWPAFIEFPLPAGNMWFYSNTYRHSTFRISRIPSEGSMWSVWLTGKGSKMTRIVSLLHYCFVKLYGTGGKYIYNNKYKLKKSYLCVRWCLVFPILFHFWVT